MPRKKTLPVLSSNDPDNLINIDAYPEDVNRPRTRGECADVPRPCPFVSCRYHLYLDLNPVTHEIKVNFPDIDVDEMHPDYSCALDIAERGALTLEDVAAATALTRERVRQLEHRATKKLRLLGSIMLKEDELEQS